MTALPSALPFQGATTQPTKAATMPILNTSTGIVRLDTVTDPSTGKQTTIWASTTETRDQNVKLYVERRPNRTGGGAQYSIKITARVRYEDDDFSPTRVSYHTHECEVKFSVDSEGLDTSMDLRMLGLLYSFLATSYDGTTGLASGLRMDKLQLGVTEL